MPRITLIETAHHYIEEKISVGDIAIDATVGNGYDTAFLLGLVGPSGRVYGFDIQQEAIAATCAKTGNPDYLTLIQASHAEMRKKIPMSLHGKIRACMFNLGYLPGSDKRIITQTEVTLAALSSATELLSTDGIITVMAYPGHTGGFQETEAIHLWCGQLDSQRFKIRMMTSDAQNSGAPKLFIVCKTA